MTRRAWMAIFALALASAAGTSAGISAVGQGSFEKVLSALPGAPFVDGDVLVGEALGLVEWYRGGRLLATLGDPEGLVRPGRRVAAAGLRVVDAEGISLDRLELSMEGEPRALFLAAAVDPAPADPRRFAGIRSVVMTYHGGELLGATRTEAILWGPHWADPAFAGDKIAGLDELLSGFGGSAYLGILREYSWRKRQRVTNESTYLGHVFDQTSPPSRALSHADAVAEACLVTGDHPDPDALYLVYTENQAANFSLCAFHTFGTCSGGAPIQAAYVPNLDGVDHCDIHDTYTTHSAGLAAIADATAHELAETITDPRASGWYDVRGQVGEIGDKCAALYVHPVTLANGTRWKLQTLWSNAAYLAGTGAPRGSHEAGCVQ